MELLHFILRTCTAMSLIGIYVGIDGRRMSNKDPTACTEGTEWFGSSCQPCIDHCHDLNRPIHELCHYQPDIGSYMETTCSSSCLEGYYYDGEMFDHSRQMCTPCDDHSLEHQCLTSAANQKTAPVLESTETIPDSVTEQAKHSSIKDREPAGYFNINAALITIAAVICLGVVTVGLTCFLYERMPMCRKKDRHGDGEAIIVAEGGVHSTIHVDS